MIREYWNVGKPGYVWCFMDTDISNTNLLKEFVFKYKSTSQYFTSKKIVAMTFEVPVSEIPNSFSRID